jgi:hypothetical protein
MNGTDFAIDILNPSISPAFAAEFRGLRIGERKLEAFHVEHLYFQLNKWRWDKRIGLFLITATNKIVKQAGGWKLQQGCEQLFAQNGAFFNPARKPGPLGHGQLSNAKMPLCRKTNIKCQVILSDKRTDIGS